MNAVPRRIGPYIIEGTIGAGGMGAVLRGRHEGTGALHAVKVVTAGDDAAPDERAAFLARFRREAEVLARMDDHPGIVRVHASGADERGRPWLAMELVDGETLEERLRREGTLAPTDAAALVAAVARAVDHAHELGVVHRDLKPGNVIVERVSGRPRVLDFGLAFEIGGERLTKTGVVAGTPAFLAPEQCGEDEGDEIGPPTDVFALGAVLHTLLTGEPPFGGGDAFGIIARILTKEPAALGRDDVAPELDAIRQKALEKEAADRYANAAALADDLEAWIRGAPVAARPPSRWRRFARRLPRGRAAPGVAILVVFGLAVAAAATGLLLAARRRNVAREVARERLKSAFEALMSTSIDEGLLDLERAEAAVADLQRLGVVSGDHRDRIGVITDFRRMLDDPASVADVDGRVGARVRVLASGGRHGDAVTLAADRRVEEADAALFEELYARIDGVALEPSAEASLRSLFGRHPPPTASLAMRWVRGAVAEHLATAGTPDEDPSLLAALEHARTALEMRVDMPPFDEELVGRLIQVALDRTERLGRADRVRDRLLESVVVAVIDHFDPGAEGAERFAVDVLLADAIIFGAAGLSSAEREACRARGLLLMRVGLATFEDRALLATTDGSLDPFIADVRAATRDPDDLDPEALWPSLSVIIDERVARDPGGRVAARWRRVLDERVAPELLSPVELIERTLRLDAEDRGRVPGWILAKIARAVGLAVGPDGARRAARLRRGLARGLLLAPDVDGAALLDRAEALFREASRRDGVGRRRLDVRASFIKFLVAVREAGLTPELLEAGRAATAAGAGIKSLNPILWSAAKGHELNTAAGHLVSAARRSVASEPHGATGCETCARIGELRAALADVIPDRPQSLELAALVARHRGAWNEALGHLTEANGKMPTTVDERRIGEAVAEVHLALGDPASARRALARVSEPPSWIPWRCERRAEILEALGDDEAARKFRAQALAVREDR